jgi:hypothetical protein
MVLIERVEVKDVSLPESMKSSMSRQAEAERERRARGHHCGRGVPGIQEAGPAAAVMAGDPAALQLRLLQTVVEVAAEKNSTLVMPVPVELLRFFGRAAPVTGKAGPAAAPGLDAAPPPVPGLAAARVPASAGLTAPLKAAPKTPASA